MVVDARFAVFHPALSQLVILCYSDRVLRPVLCKLVQLQCYAQPYVSLFNSATVVLASLLHKSSATDLCVVVCGSVSYNFVLLCAKRYNEIADLVGWC